LIRRARVAFLILSPLLLLALLAGFRFNHTHSFPVGVYWTAPKVAEVGDLGLFDPPDTPLFRLARGLGCVGSGGFRPYERMLKRLVAIGGDVVIIDDAGAR
jgi:type IV secretory pathway protease TraF